MSLPIFFILLSFLSGVLMQDPLWIDEDPYDVTSPVPLNAAQLPPAPTDNPGILSTRDQPLTAAPAAMKPTNPVISTPAIDEGDVPQSLSNQNQDTTSLTNQDAAPTPPIIITEPVYGASPPRFGETRLGTTNPRLEDVRTMSTTRGLSSLAGPTNLDTTSSYTGGVFFSVMRTPDNTPSKVAVEEVPTLAPSADKRTTPTTPQSVSTTRYTGPDSEFLNNKWGRIIVRVVQNCFEATNESTIVSTTCNKTEPRQIWRFNERNQIQNFAYKSCLTPSTSDGRDPRVILERCSTVLEDQVWETVPHVLDDFKITSPKLQLCLDVNGYALVRKASVQLGVCEDAFDSAGRISDQYLQFYVAYSQIEIESTGDTVSRHREPARVSCKLKNSPKPPDYILWTNGIVQIEEFSGREGFSLSTGVFYDNSMLSILTIEYPVPDSWTCLFTVDGREFSARVEVDIPQVTCAGRLADESLTASMQCCYRGKYQPTEITWQKEGKSVVETAQTYQITAGLFQNKTQCSTVHFGRDNLGITFSVTFKTPYKTISETVISGPVITQQTTSPPWRTSIDTSNPGYIVDNNSVEMDEDDGRDKNMKNNSISAESIQNSSSCPSYVIALVTLLQLLITLVQ